ncbi:MAG: MATE family efflux transporter [Paracoccaceae bacterium]|nr:MATE family efflux transporter [Paracoccaceae bacterium]
MTGSAASPPRPITHRRIWAIAGPIVLSNATVPILGLVDTGVVGQIGDPVPIGAVGIGAIILTAVYWVFGFLRMGTVGLTSQALGAGDRAEADALLSRALLVAVAGGAVVIAFQVFIFAAAFQVSPASAEVERLARDYMQIRIWSAPVAIALYGITGWLIAAERTRAVLVVQVWMNGLNIVLDLVFVLGLGWGVAGVAIATLMAEWAGLAMGLWLCRDAFGRAYWRQRERVLDRTRLLRMAYVNRDILIRSLLLESIFVSFLFLGARFGDVPLAANQVLLQFLHVISFALDGFAFSAETLVGNAYGRKSPDRVRRASLMASSWGLLVAIGLSLTMWVLGPMGIDILTTSEEVREAAKALLPWIVMAPVLSVAAYMLDGIFVGATRTADMRNMMVVSAVIYAVAVWALVPVLGNHGLWLALLISLFTRGVTLGIRYPALERAAA